MEQQTPSLGEPEKRLPRDVSLLLEFAMPRPGETPPKESLGEGPDSGDREPRKPLPQSGAGVIELPVPAQE
jgi:hypothetical protein